MLFEEPGTFNIEINGNTMQVREHEMGLTHVFRVNFSDNRTPLVITKAKTASGDIWMSISQGRQEEALQIGRKITEYFKGR